jgi:hypothetical protein
MSATDQHLDEWRAAGLIDDQTQNSIRAYEREKRATRPRTEIGESFERPSAIEALLYLGIVIVAAGAFTLGVQNWDDLQQWARVAALGVPGILAVLVGFALKNMRDSQFIRAGHVAWFAAVPLITGAVAVFLGEYVYSGTDNEEGKTVLLLVASFATILAGVLWTFAPSNPQILALAGAIWFLSTAIASWGDDFNNQFAGVLLVIIAAAAIALAEKGWLTPGFAARLLFSILGAFGAYFTGIGNADVWPEVLAFATAGALIAVSVWRSQFIFMAVGVVLAFVTLITFVFERFSDELGAPVALILSGGLVIAGVLLLTQLRGILRSRRPASA